MKCRKHEWRALFRIPRNVSEACTFALRSYGRYVRCTHCGLIGRVIHSRRSGVRILRHPDDQQSWQSRAEEWNSGEWDERSRTFRPFAPTPGDGQV